MSRSLLAALLLLPAVAAAQGGLPAAGVFFDDFSYRDTRPPLGGIASRPLHENALFGVNTWCLDLRCARSVPARGWYWYNAFEAYFQRVDSLTTLTAMPGGPLAGALDFTIGRGQHRLEGTAQRQIGSGFAGGEGVWAASVVFSALPNGLPEHMVARGTPTRVSMMQSVWMISPARAVTTPNPGTPSREQTFGGTELDFEYTNWFFDSGRPRYIATGYSENDEDPDGDGHRAATTRLAAPTADAPLYSCQIARRGRRPETASPDACDAVLAGQDRDAGPDVPTTLVLRRERTRTRFEAHAAWDGGRSTLTMVTPWTTVAGQPSQLTTLMLSVYLVDHGEAVVDVPADQRMRVDWVYFTPDAARSTDAVLADVARIRRRTRGRRPAVRRLFTIPAANPAAAIERPFRLRRAGDRDPAPIIPTESIALHDLVVPRTARPDRPVEAVAVLSRVAADMLVEWRLAPMDAQGRTGVPTAWDNTPGVRWRPTVPGSPPCVRIDARATRLAYHSGPDGVWWTAALAENGAPDQSETSRVTCAPGQPRPPGL